MIRRDIQAYSTISGTSMMTTAANSPTQFEVYLMAP